MPPKTHEQLQMEENEKRQHEAWMKAERLNCRKIALCTSEHFQTPDAEQMLRQADIIYEWLIEGLE